MARVFDLCRKLERLTGHHIAVAQAEQAAGLAHRTGDGFSHCHAMNGTGVHVDAAGRIYACSSFVGDARFLLGEWSMALMSGGRKRPRMRCRAAWNSAGHVGILHRAAEPAGRAAWAATPYVLQNVL